MPVRVVVSELAEDDLEEVLRFQQEQTGAAGGQAAPPRPGMESAVWLLLENPEVSPDLPIGFVAREESGRVVGMKLCVPQRFQCGEQQFVLLLGGGYYVSSEHRGVGLRLMREFLATGDRVSQYANTMNEVSGAIYERYGGYPINDTEHEMVGVLRWSPFLEEVLARRLRGGRLARFVAAAGALLPARVGSRAEGELRELSNAEELKTLSFETPAEHAQQITAVRGIDYLRWRYFEGPDRSRSVFEYRHPSGATALVTTRLQPRGHRGQIRSLMVLDYWGAVPADAVADVARLLARRFRGDADMLVFRCQPPERQTVLRRAGLMHRSLPRAVGVCIDRAERLPTRQWYMVPADGDMAT